jgi:hypothetical protein
MDVNAGPVPTLEPMNGKRVAEVVGSRAYAAGGWLESSAPEKGAHRVRGAVGGQRSPARADEEALAGECATDPTTRHEVPTQLACQRSMKRYPSRTALAGRDEQNALVDIHVADAKPHRFTKADARTIEDEQQSAVEVSREAGAKCTGGAQQRKDLELGEDVRKEV